MNSSQQAVLVLVENKYKPSIVFKEFLSTVTLGTDRAWDTEALWGTDKIIRQTASIRKNCPRAPWSLSEISSGCALPILTIFSPFLKTGCERFRLIYWWSWSLLHPPLPLHLLFSGLSSPGTKQGLGANRVTMLAAHYSLVDCAETGKPSHVVVLGFLFPASHSTINIEYSNSAHQKTWGWVGYPLHQ